MNNDLPNDELLMHYLEGELEGEELARFEASLQSDPSLSRRLDDLRIAM